MLSFLRRLTHSKVGVVITLGLLALLALAFGMSDITGLTPGGGPTGAQVLTVGDAAVTDSDLQQRLRIEVDGARQQQPDITMQQFVQAGGMEAVVRRLINGITLEQFGEASGMVPSQALVDGQIASIPAFQGFNGQFDQQTFERALAQRNITQEQLRADIRRDIIAQWLIAPTIGASQVSSQQALPYASLLLERRRGQVAFVPARPEAAAAPSDAELQRFYASNRSRYTVPERRVLRYAIVSPDRFAEQVQVSDAEVQQAYRAAGDKYAPTSTRTLQQVIVADQAAANRIATAVKGGQAIDAAARAAGLEATTIENVTQAAFASQSAAPVAQAAFAAPEGGVAGPVRSPFGFHIIRVQSVSQSAGRSLDQVRDELVAEVRQRKALEALTQVQERLDTGITDGATFDELVAESRLQAQQTANVTAQGVNPEDPASQPDPRLARVVEAGFAAEEGDSPQLVQLDQQGTFAIVALQGITPSAARPLAQIRDRVAADYRLDQARRTARQQADAVVANVNRGTALAQAVTAAGVQGPAPESLELSRAELAAQRQQLPPPVELMFSMKQGTAKVVEAPDRSGWFVVTVTGIDRGNAQGNQNAINATRQGLGSVVGREYAEQFTNAARAIVGVERNEAALARVRATLTGEAQ